MDKGWMSMNRLSQEYEDGVESFLHFALENATDSNLIPCPCAKCANLSKKNITIIRAHLFCHGMDLTYKKWIWHGERRKASESPNDGVRDGLSDEDCDVEDPINMVQDAYDFYQDNPSQFQELLEDAQKPLYFGCRKFTKLSATVKMYNLKAKYSWSDTSFTDLLSLLREMLPEGNEIPLSCYSAKKILSTLGMNYKKIHACPSDCILYRKEYEDLTDCPTCGKSRWKVDENSASSVKIPAKVLWYFPPIPRFRRMFQTKEISKELTWHADKRLCDGYLRHPADAPAWKLVDNKWPDFSLEPRNLRLALAADGINPYSFKSSNYSCWPIILVTYNLPPWLCMKRKFLMLTLLISGPKQPGNDIDIYLAPLIDDLKELWEVGIQAYDAYRDQIFTLSIFTLITVYLITSYLSLTSLSLFLSLCLSSVCRLSVCPRSQQTGFPVCIRVRIGDRTFNLHKLPLTCKSGYFREKLKDTNEVELPPNFPGGADTFETIALLLYGSSSSSSLVDPLNVASLRCAAEFLHMREDYNLCERFDVYLNQVILQSWNDTLIVLQTCHSLLPWAEDLLIVTRCIEALAFMACMEILDPDRRAEQPQGITPDLWIQDVIALPLAFFKRLIASLRRQGMREKYVTPILLFHAHKWVLSPIRCDDESRKNLQGVIDLLPAGGGSKASRVIPVRFYLSLLSASVELRLRNDSVEKLQNQTASLLHLAQPQDLDGMELSVMERVFTTYDAYRDQSIWQEELYGDEEIDRAIMWKKARLSKEGDTKDENLKMTIQKIDKYIREKEDGVFKSKGRYSDLLTSALEKPEHSGRVQGIGAYVNPTTYFNCPRETRQRISKEQLHVLEDANKRIQEQDSVLKEYDARIHLQDKVIYELVGRIDKLEESISAKDRFHEEKSSCSVKFHKEDKIDYCTDDEEVVLIDKATTLLGKSVALALGSTKTIVGYGTVVTTKNTLHGAPIPKDCLCVSIDEVVDEDAPLPFPIPDISDIVGNAVGSHVAWPSQFVVLKDEMCPKKMVEKKIDKKKMIKRYATLPSSLKALYCCVERSYKDGQGILLPLDVDVFGSTCDIFIHLEDITPFCELDPISGNCIVGYIWHLYRRSKEENTSDRFIFVNPFTVSYDPKVERNDRARMLADRLFRASSNQLVVVPCNVGEHWILTIIQPHKELIILMDPLTHQNRDNTWKCVVDIAVNMFNVNVGKKSKKAPTWEIIKGPIQPDSKQCGFYVMRFMKEILKGFKKNDFISLKSMFQKKEYSQNEIDEVREEWASCVIDYV